MRVAFSSKFYEALAAHKFNRLAAALGLTVSAVCVLYFSFLAQHDSAPVNVIVVPNLPLVRAEPSSVRPPNVASLSAAGNIRPTTAASLTRALQTGLAGAGCYDGAINGVWTSKTQDAMRRFVSAANARLPVDAPDEFQLALVKSNSTLKCADRDAPSPNAEIIATTDTAPTSQQPPLIKAPVATPAPQLSRPVQRDIAPVAPAPPAVTNAALLTDTDRIAPPVAVAAPAVASNATDVGAVNANSAPTLAPAKQRYRAVSQRRTKYARKKPSTIDSVSRSITKSVNSLQRSLGSLLN